jgi:hypothetical protein
MIELMLKMRGQDALRKMQTMCAEFCFPFVDEEEVVCCVQSSFATQAGDFS